jgi:hypothetical protein
MLVINPLNAELNPICHLLALLGGATIVVVSRLRVNNNYTEMYGQRNIKLHKSCKPRLQFINLLHISASKTIVRGVSEETSGQKHGFAHAMWIKRAMTRLCSRRISEFF